MMLMKNKRLNLIALMVAAIVLTTLVETSNAENVVGIYCQDKDFIDNGLDWITGNSGPKTGISMSVGGGKCGVGETTVYTQEQRLLFIGGLLAVAGLIVVAAICCCCCCCCTDNNRSSPPPLPVVITHNRYSDTSAYNPAAMGAAAVSAPIYPNYSTVTV